MGLIWTLICEAVSRVTARLCSAILDFVEVQGADISNACLCKEWMAVTDLSGANFAGSNVEAALTFGPILSGTRFSVSGWNPAKGIMQSDLNPCRANPDDLPELAGVSDAETGAPLVWSGKSLDDQG